MKKTFITLLAMAGLAMGAQEPITIGNANNTASTTSDFFSSVAAESANISGSASFTSTAYTQSFFSVATNVGNGGGYDYVLTFTLAKDADLFGVNVDFMLYNAGGKAQPVNRTLSYDITLTSTVEGSSPLLNLEDQTITTTTGATAGDAVYTDAAYTENGAFAEQTKAGVASFTLPENTFLQAGVEYQLTIANIAKADTGAGTFVGIGNIKMDIIPEPATATLSLLALCGLAARRRRK